MITLGRTLDADGTPIPGTGFTVDGGGAVVDRLRERIGPLTAHPDRGYWSAQLPAPDDADGSCRRTLSVFAPGYDGPPTHYHIASTESFAVRRGTFRFTLDGATRRLSAGESVTVDPGTEHTFEYIGDGLGVVLVDVAPPGRIGHLIPTFAGLAHDDAADGVLQRAATIDRLANDTVFTDLPPELVESAAALLAPIARLRGLQGGYERYRRAAFWERHVEQPSL